MKPQRPPLARSVSAALDDSAMLAGLLAGHRRSRACFEAIRPCLPPALMTQVRPGPIDEQVWSLLASTGGAASKLRQLLPRLVEAVGGAGHDIKEIRVKVSPPG